MLKRLPAEWLSERDVRSRRQSHPSGKTGGQAHSIALRGVHTHVQSRTHAGPQRSVRAWHCLNLEACGRYGVTRPRSKRKRNRLPGRSRFFHVGSANLVDATVDDLAADSKSVSRSAIERFIVFAGFSIGILSRTALRDCWFSFSNLFLQRRHFECELLPFATFRDY